MEQLEGFAAVARSSTGDESIFENFEFIAAIAKQHLDYHKELYPAGVPRRRPRLSATTAELLAKTQPKPS